LNGDVLEKGGGGNAQGQYNFTRKETEKGKRRSTGKFSGLKGGGGIKRASSTSGRRCVRELLGEKGGEKWLGPQFGNIWNLSEEKSIQDQKGNFIHRGTGFARGLKL